MVTKAPARTTIDPFTRLVLSFERHLLAENKAPKTVATYLDAVRFLRRFLDEQGMPTAPDHIRREHIEAFIVDQLERWKPATASNRFRALQQFFKWLRDEGEVPETPMARMRPPIVPEEPVPVLSEEQIRAILKACEGKAFADRRDHAILLLLLDTGMRRSELVGLVLNDIDFTNNIASVLGKGRRPRACPFGRTTARALDRYLRLRDQHPDADLDALWLGRTGALKSTGVMRVVKRRATQAGYPGVYPHLFRHRYAHQWLADGGSETDLMRLTGWRSRSMLQRYAASTADERARNAYQTQGRSPADRLRES